MYSISNRRYTGSKYKLLDWIEKLILENCEGDSFFDVFAGTGVVSAHMSKHYKKVIMNDFLYSNEIIYKAFFGNGEFDKAVIEKYREQFRKINPNRLKDNYFSENFGGKYFSNNDAKIIGKIREEIKKSKRSLSDREYCILLASLVYSMDKVANTVGHYDAYRKIKNIDDKFVYELINPEKPPYNSRQYSRFYHILENIVQWKKPKLEGTALKPQAENMSEYCRSDAPEVFADLIKNIDVKYIVVTYNNTYNSKSSSSRNKITLEQIKDILSAKGKTMIYEKRHQCFNAGKTEFDNHKEFVFITKVGEDDGK